MSLLRRRHKTPAEQPGVPARRPTLLAAQCPNRYRSRVVPVIVAAAVAVASGTLLGLAEVRGFFLAVLKLGRGARCMTRSTDSSIGLRA